MEIAKAMRESWLTRIVGLAAAVLWLGSAAILTLPRTVHAQDDSGVSTDNGANDDSDINNNDDNSVTGDSDDTDASDPDATVPNVVGTWTGTAFNKKLGTGTLSVIFSQQLLKTVAVSAWEVDFGDDTTSLGGFGAGKLAGKALKLTLGDETITPGNCRMIISGKVKLSDGTPSEIKGSFALKGCLKHNYAGKIDLTPAAS